MMVNVDATGPKTVPPPERPTVLASCSAHLRSRESVTRCLVIALVVGTILTAVNQADAFLGDDYTPWIWLKVALNYLIPFVVSSAGFISAARRQPRDAGD
jgi:hypothetical protein